MSQSNAVVPAAPAQHPSAHTFNTHGMDVSADYLPLSDEEKSSGWCTIIGFGSLLSVRSAHLTMPQLRNFRAGIILDYRRVFRHVAPIFVERGIAIRETLEVSSVSVEPAPGQFLVCTVMEIPIASLPDFYARELEFRWTHVDVYQLANDQHRLQLPVSNSNSSSESAPSWLVRDPLAISGRGIICASYTDEEYRRDRLRGNEAWYEQTFGKWGIPQIWRDDLKPCRVYLRHCILAAAKIDFGYLSTIACCACCNSALTAAAAAAADTSSSAVSPKHIRVEILRWREGGAKCEKDTIELTRCTHRHNSKNDAQSVCQCWSLDDGAAASSASTLISITPSDVRVCNGATLQSFLQHSFLGDRRTSIGDYLNSPQGSVVMCSQPPPSFIGRYSG